MGEILKKPYEISIWEDITVTENGNSYVKERRLATIGADYMTSPNRVYSPILNKKVNGEVQLTFSMAYKYFDSASGLVVINPFANYLINERKVKLKYDGEWYDLRIKECEESSEDMVFTYTCGDLFVNELSRNGFNITLSSDLNNNQGTAIELGEKALQGTDWEVDKESCDLLQQLVKEPLYKYTIGQSSTITVTDLETNLPVNLSNEVIYVFYSYIANKQTEFVQFIREADRYKFAIDDNGVITAPNYRFQKKVNEEDVSIISYDDNNNIIYFGTTITYGGIYTANQANRLVYGQLTTYDPIMERTVNIYEAEFDNENRQVYQYTDYEYTTSDVVTNYVTNGSDFEAFSDSAPAAWSAMTQVSHNANNKYLLQPLNVVSYPEVGKNLTLEAINKLKDVQGFLEVKFNDVGKIDGTIKNTYFNSGIMDNASIIDHISKGEEYVLRVCGGWKNSSGVMNSWVMNTTGLRAVVASYDSVSAKYYDADGQSVDQYYVYKIKQIYIDFDGNFTICNNEIKNGNFNDNYKQYIIDGVAQEPAVDYIYSVNGSNRRVWNTKTEMYETYNQNKFLNYYMTTARAKRPISNKEMADPKLKIGIFLYTDDTNRITEYAYIKDVQLFKCVRDANNQPVILGNIPEAKSTETDFYYLKPKDGTLKEEIQTYSSIESFKSEYGLKVVKPVYNGDCEKVLSIDATQSNCFNILQSICETFECWLKLEVPHHDDGSLILDENNVPIKRVAFKQYAGKDNFAGFKYGINLKSIQRTLDSDEIVTKLIVGNEQQDTTDEGSVGIQSADSNPSGESYILNFDYFLNKGLIDDRDQFQNDLAQYYTEMKGYNKQIFELRSKQASTLNSINKIGADLDVYSELLSEAEADLAEAMNDFETLANMSYSTYVANTNKKASEQSQEFKNIKDHDDLIDSIGRIYQYSIVRNNYTGLYTNKKSEYDKLMLECYGAKDYSFVATTIKDGNNWTTRLIVDDYAVGFGFSFIRGGNILSYEVTENERSFEVTESSPYNQLRIDKLPKKLSGNNFGYRVLYTSPNKIIYTYGAGSLITIAKGNDNLTTNFRLVPTTEYKNSHKGYEEQIAEIQALKDAEEQKFYKKYSRFIQEGTWSSNEYIDPELYYLDALQVSNTSAQPKVTYSIDVLEISEIEGFQNYNFDVGDKTYMEDEEYFGYARVLVDNKYVITPAREEVIVSEVEWNLDSPEENKIVVQNYKTQFEDLFQRIAATVQSVQYNQATYAKAATLLDSNGTLNSDILIDSLNDISKTGFNLTSDGTVITNGEGILVRNLQKPNNLVKIVGEGIKISNDGGNTWKSAITANGISTDLLNIGSINVQDIMIKDGDNPSFRWDKYGLNAYGFDPDGGPFDLKTYVRFDKYGVYGIQGAEDFKVNSLEDIQETAKFGMTWDGFFIKNSYADGYVSVSSDEDIQVVGTNLEKNVVIAPAEPLSVVTNMEFIEPEEVEEEPQEQGQSISPNVSPLSVLPTRGLMAAGNRDLVEAEPEPIGYIYMGPDNPIIDSVIDANEQVLEYTVEGDLITVYDSGNYVSEVENPITVTYLLPMNVVDLGGSGILKINSVYRNGNLVDPSNYSYDREEALLTFIYELNPSDVLTVNYRLEHIKIGALEFDSLGNPQKYGIKIQNSDGESVFETNDEGNLTVTGTINARDGVFNGTVYAHDGEFTGTIHAQDGDFSGHVNATSGDFSGYITVGNTAGKYLLIDGTLEDPIIASSDYIQNINAGWSITGTGDAIFNNIIARGAIKTAVFEYSEIEAVGGAFLFRPSTTIKKAYVVTDNVTVDNISTIFTYNQIRNKFIGYIEGLKAATIEEITITGRTFTYEYNEFSNKITIYCDLEVGDDTTQPLIINNISVDYIQADLVLKVDKPEMFDVGEWVKLSNYNDPADSLETGGLAAVYKIIEKSDQKELTLEGGGAIFYTDDMYPQEEEEEQVIEPGQVVEEPAAEEEEETPIADTGERFLITYEVGEGYKLYTDYGTACILTGLSTLADGILDPTEEHNDVESNGEYFVRFIEDDEVYSVALTTDPQADSAVVGYSILGNVIDNDTTVFTIAVDDHYIKTVIEEETFVIVDNETVEYSCECTNGVAEITVNEVIEEPVRIQFVYRKCDPLEVDDYTFVLTYVGEQINIFSGTLTAFERDNKVCLGNYDRYIEGFEPEPVDVVDVPAEGIELDSSKEIQYQDGHTYKYKITFGGEDFTKISDIGELIRTYTPELEEGEEPETVSVTYEFKYVGNLNLLDGDASNTGEDFLVISMREKESGDDYETTLYVREAGSYVFDISLDEEGSNVVELEGGALISFGFEVDNSNVDGQGYTYRVKDVKEGMNPSALHLYEKDSSTTPPTFTLTEDTEPETIPETDIPKTYYARFKNYGIGINSSDDYIKLPARAISLFDTVIKPNASIKVEYNMQAVLGTLPYGVIFPTDSQDSGGIIYNQFLANTQGLFTDNVYLGNATNYLTFYTDQTDNNTKKLRITGADIYLTSDATDTLVDVISSIEVGEGMFLTITSSNGRNFEESEIKTTLTAHLYKEGTEVQTYSAIRALGYDIKWYSGEGYILTKDTRIISGKNYYTYNSGIYTLVTNPDISLISTYYELLSSETYIKSGIDCIVGPPDQQSGSDIHAFDSINIIIKLEDISNS